MCSSDLCRSAVLFSNLAGGMDLKEFTMVLESMVADFIVHW